MGTDVSKKRNHPPLSLVCGGDVRLCQIEISDDTVTRMLQIRNEIM